MIIINLLGSEITEKLKKQGYRVIDYVAHHDYVIKHRNELNKQKIVILTQRKNSNLTRKIHIDSRAGRLKVVEVSSSKDLLKEVLDAKIMGIPYEPLSGVTNIRNIEVIDPRKFKEL